MSSSVEMEWVTDFERFDALAEPWGRLSEKQPTPFASHAWFGSWWRAFGGGLALRILACWEGEELVAVMPLCTRGRRTLALANEHTPVFDPPYRDEASLKRTLDTALDSGLAEISVPALPEGAVLAAFVAASREAGRLSFVEADHASPVVDTSPPIDQYKKTRKSELRPIERKRRKLMREHDATFSLVEAPEDLEAELARGFALEASGWKGRSGTAVASDPRTAAFYRSIAHARQADGQVRLSTLSIDGQLAAFDLCLLHAGRLHLLKTAYDEAFSRLAPGLVLRLAVIERCFDLGLEAHDLGGDRAEWKLKFSTGQREHRFFRAYSKELLPALRYVYWRLGRPILRRAYHAAAAAHGRSRAGA